MKRPVFRSVLLALLFMGCTNTGPTSGPAPASCNDGQWNGQETDFDCGGPVCGKCEAQKACLVHSDCASGTCLTSKLCSTPGSGADLSVADLSMPVADLSMPPADMTTPPPTGMIKRVVYSDTFTLGGARTNGLYNDNSAGGYRVETSPDGAVWKLYSNFSFNSPGTSTNPSLLLSATGNSGASTGLAQSGGGDFSLSYNDPAINYTVQADAIIPNDRFDISSMPFAGATIGDTGALSIFFRRPGATMYPTIGIFGGGVELDTGCTTGISDKNWHNFAVNFDQGTNHVRMFVDRTLRCDLDLTTFGGGRFRSYSKAAVGIGVGGFIATWADNFQAGPA